MFQISQFEKRSRVVTEEILVTYTFEVGEFYIDGNCESHLILAQCVGKNKRGLPIMRYLNDSSEGWKDFVVHEPQLRNFSDNYKKYGSNIPATDYAYPQFKDCRR